VLPVTIFISYAHEDAGWCDKLKAHLRIVERDGVAKVWTDAEIELGAEWDVEIRTALNEAKVILLLVSSDFINSDFCYGKEMVTAMERHDSGDAIVVPVSTRYVDWGMAPFGKLQGYDPKHPLSEGDADKNLADLVSKLRTAILKRWSGNGAGPIPVSRSTLKEPPVALPYLCDRSVQEQVLREMMGQTRAAAVRRPYLILVHGAHDECHEGFLNRLEKVTLPRLLEMDTKPVSRLDLQWPEGVSETGTVVQVFGTLLADSLKLSPFVPLEQMQLFATGATGISMFTCVLDGMVRDRNTPVLVNKFLEFWNLWPDVPVGRALVVCLDIKYEAGSRGMRKIVAQTSVESFKGLFGCKLPELHAVERYECEALYGNPYVREYVDSSRRPNWEADVDRLYLEFPRAGIPMSKLVPHLREMLPRYAR
jgi:hypothetical protein